MENFLVKHLFDTLHPHLTVHIDKNGQKEFALVLMRRGVMVNLGSLSFFLSSQSEDYFYGCVFSNFLFARFGFSVLRAHDYGN